MKKKLTLILIIFFFNKILFATENKIEFKVNNEIISSIDIQNEIRLLTSLNPNLLELDKIKIFEIASNSLVNEKIKKIEILNYVKNLEMNTKYLDNLIQNNYRKLNIETKKDFEIFLNKNGSSLKDFEKKLTIESLWNEIIFLKYKKSLNIDEKKIKEELIKSSSEKVTFNLSEIVFNLSKDEKLKDKSELISKEILEKGFENTALIYSISGSSGLGGKLGWIDADSLNKDLKNKLSNLDIGEIIDPFTIPGGFLILKLNDIKKVKVKEQIDLEAETKKIIRLKTNQQLNQFSNIYFNKIKKNSTIEKI